MARASAEPLAIASRLSPTWLADQRWFRAKRRRIVAVAGVDAFPLTGETIWLLVLGVRFADGGEERYLLPAVTDAAGVREPADGEGAWRSLAASIVSASTLRGVAGGSLRCEPGPGLGAVLGDGADVASLPERRLGVEQSNTSVALGERLMLKLYRLAEPGINPEVELSAFLTEVGFHQTPALAGWIQWDPPDGAPCAAAMLQERLPATGDGWEWALGCLASLAGREAAIVGVTRIGQITALLHAALASRPDAPGFEVRDVTAPDLVAWRASAERQLQRALAALDASERSHLESIAPQLEARLDAIGRTGDARVSRLHGDYHLGQLLRVGSDFSVVDFEGEPARPLAERREPSSPLRDVAGMLRSLDYAARTVARDRRSWAGEADAWLSRARAAFLGAYGRLSAGDAALLAAFEVEKACYEAQYEANNRPDWTWLPLEALVRLAA
jgi:trehalose synthase-fused probable maltokinase